jgi:radical SAM superfamily enzyme YgiQ (UPF0313 family)
MTDVAVRIKGGTPTAAPAALVVVISGAGPVLPGHIELGPVPLGLAELRLLAALSTGDVDRDRAVDDLVDRHPGTRPQLTALLTTLDERHLDPAGWPDTPIEDVVPRPLVVTDERLGLLMPVVFRPRAGGFEALDHDGRRTALLDPLEVMALAPFVPGRTRAEAFAEFERLCGEEAIDQAAFEGFVEASGAQFLHVVDPDFGTNVGQRLRRLLRANQLLGVSLRDAVADHEANERRRVEQGAAPRTRVVPVGLHQRVPPLALGDLIAYAMAHDGGRLQEHYHFPPSWEANQTLLEPLLAEPGIFLFSNYLWTHEAGLELSEHVKTKSPESITVHGGPDTPKYRADVEGYFAEFPHVDVTVRGEGEITAAEILDRLIGRVGNGPVDLSVLADVPGLSFRTPDGIVHTPDRERIADLSVLPSPYLTGLFDVYGTVPDSLEQVTLESNRGCPYGCTYCDWGSATLSRIRKRPMEDVLAEIDWCGEKGALTINMADANYGIFARDVEIAERVVDIKKRYGIINGFGANYAKNTVKHLTPIIKMMIDNGVVAPAVLSLQTMDEATLEAVERSNIKIERYDELAVEFRRLGQRLVIELMIGLPGSTTTSVENDLQECLDREVETRANTTIMLVNSPMNTPEYRQKFDLKPRVPVGDPRQLAHMSSSSTYSADDLDESRRLVAAYYLFEDFGVLRQVARYLRHRAGLREIDLYKGVLLEATRAPERWPAMAVAAQWVPTYMGPPVSWALFFDELRRYLVERVGIADDSGLDTVLQVQRALVPAHGRHYPQILELAHDYPAWAERVVTAKEEHRLDWPDHVPDLRTLGPATMAVEDPQGATTANLGVGVLFKDLGVHWELDAPVTRLRTWRLPTVDA